jgi:HAD superfamily hydrolase (TIGR01509 family)
LLDQVAHELMSALRALIFDVDGTLAETERDGHRVAFNRAFAALDLPWQWDEGTYGVLLRVAGGYERLLSFLARQPQAPASAAAREALARTIHQRKNAEFAALLAQGGIAPRPGVRRIIEECAGQGVLLAVATTTGRANLDALFPQLFGADWQQRFATLVCAEDAPRKKPDPQVYQIALARLGVTPQQALAVEDSPAGLAAAGAAGIACLITRSVYFADADFGGAAAVVADLDAMPNWPCASPRVDLAALRALHALRA